MQLSELQQQFKQSYNTNEKQFSVHIKSRGNLNSAQRLQIYHDSVTECLANALREIYPVCKQLVGDEFFSAMAYQYITTHPSTSPTLFDYGDLFPEFIANFAPAESVPYLADVAKLEWTSHRCYYSIDDAILDPTQLAAVPEAQQDDIIFELGHDSDIISSRYPIKRIMELHQGVDGDIDLSQGGESVFVYKKLQTVCFDVLSVVQTEFLQGVKRGQRFGDLCEIVINHHPGCDLEQLLCEVVQHGWVIGFHT